MDSYTRERIENITEDDFWSSFDKKKIALCDAVANGVAGKKKQAYLLLRQYHADSLSCERDEWMSDWGNAVIDRESLGHLTNHEKAEAVMRHDICGWHTHRIQFASVIDFNADFGKTGQYGFHYLTWLAPVLREYTLSGDPKYARKFLEIIQHYYSQRTSLKWRIPHLHPVYYELGVAAKTPLLLSACAILSPCDIISSVQYEGMMKLLLGFARSLFRIQKCGYKTGNWQIVGARTLYWLGSAFSEFKESKLWRKRAESILDEHLKQDFFSDGGHSERCWGYGAMSLNGMFEHYRDACRYGRLVGVRKARWTRFLKCAFRWFAKSTAPGNLMLNYGDGHISSADDLIAKAEKIFPDFARAGGMLGVDRSESYFLKTSGYAFMRAGNGDGESPYISINWGKSGGWHTHSDLLDFSLWCYGKPLIEEVGRFGSYDNPLDHFFRSPEAHNQIVLPHLPMQRHSCGGENILWHTTEKADFFSGEHYAYKEAVVKRQILFVKPEPELVVDGKIPDSPTCCCLIYDVVTAEELSFQVQNVLHAPSLFKQNDCSRPIWLAGNDDACIIACARNDDFRRVTTDVDYSCSEHEHNTDERHRLTFWKWRDIGDNRPVTFVTLLVPCRAGNMPAIEINELAVDDCSGEAGAFDVSVDKIRFKAIFNPSREKSVSAVLDMDSDASMILKFDDGACVICPQNVIK